MMKQEVWGAIRIRTSQLEKIDEVIAQRKEFDSRSDFVSQILTIALEKY